RFVKNPRIPAASNTPPIVRDHSSYEPSGFRLGGDVFPCAIQCLMRIRADQTHPSRLSSVHFRKSECLNPFSIQGLSTFRSSRIRMERRAISVLIIGLFAVVTHTHFTGKLAVSFLPRRRSPHSCAVSAEANSPESSVVVTLSMTITGRSSLSSAVILLRHSSPL